MPTNTALQLKTTSILDKADSHGFRDFEVAKKVTSNLARGLDASYWLVKDHRGLYYFVKQLPIPQRLNAPDNRDIQLNTMKYVGMTVVGEVDATGRWL